MLKKQLFLFNTSSIAAVYGIGTYIKQLAVCVSSLDMELSVVHLRAGKQKMSIETDANVRYIDIPSPKFKDERNPTRNENSFFRSVTYLLRPYISLEGDVIFHLNFMNDLALCNQLKLAFPSVRIVLTVHYMDWAFSLLGNKAQFLSILHTPEEELKTDMERSVLWSKKRSEELLHHCDRIITIASHESDLLRELFHVNPDKITLVHNALKDSFDVRLNRNQLRAEWYIPPHEKIILFVGRMDKMKGFPILLKAFDRLLQDDPNLRLFVAGGGNFQEQFSAIDRYWSKVTFTGFLPQEKLFELYTIADLGVMPSMYEEFGFVAIEMMMHGLPIVANKTSGLEEIVENEVTGLHVLLSGKQDELEANSQWLSQSLSSILYDEKRRQCMSKNARKRFLAKYEEGLFRQRMLQFYCSIIT